MTGKKQRKTAARKARAKNRTPGPPPNRKKRARNGTGAQPEAGTAVGDSQPTVSEEPLNASGEEDTEPSSPDAARTPQSATGSSPDAPSPVPQTPTVQVALSGSETHAEADAEPKPPSGGTPDSPSGSPGASRSPLDRVVPDSAAKAFDMLYAEHARTLTRQAFLLCGHRRAAERAVAHAFHTAWERWPEVARDRDPAGWVRAATYEYALSPWHQLRPGWRRPEAHPGPPTDRALLDGLLALPRSYRSTLLLHDGLGLSLPDTAAETEASTSAAAGRLRHARKELAKQVPELRDAPPERRKALITARLRELAAAQPTRAESARVVRSGSEHTTRLRTRAAVGLATVVTAATAFTTATADEPGPAGPQQPRTFAPHGPGQPETGTGTGTAGTAESAYLPQLRSINARMNLDDFVEHDDAQDGTGPGPESEPGPGRW